MEKNRAAGEARSWDTGKVGPKGGGRASLEPSQDGLRRGSAGSLPGERARSQAGGTDTYDQRQGLNLAVLEGQIASQALHSVLHLDHLLSHN